MAVLVEGISVVVRRDAINSKYPGGWDQFLAKVPNNTLCFDDELARVGFMLPQDVSTYVHHLRAGGLGFFNGKFVDLVVVDQFFGPTGPCDWLEFTQIRHGDEGWISACWLYEGKRALGEAIYVSTPDDQAPTLTVALPEGWDFGRSLSKTSALPTGAVVQERLQFIRREGEGAVYLDRMTSREIHVGRFKETSSAEDVEFLRTEGNIDIYRNRETGEEIYVGRTRTAG